MICPSCGGMAESDTVDIGVGTLVRGNYHCEGCNWTKVPGDGQSFGLIVDDDPFGLEL